MFVEGMAGYLGKEIHNPNSDGWSDELQCYISEEMLVPIDPPAPVLTEWQEKELRRFTNTMNIVVIDMHDLKSILFEPEPPKYIPKHGDAIRLRDRESDPWMVDVFDKMINDGRDYLGFNMAGKYCIPFDLIGTSDNPKF